MAVAGSVIGNLHRNPTKSSDRVVRNIVLGVHVDCHIVLGLETSMSRNLEKEVYVIES